MIKLQETPGVCFSDIIFSDGSVDEIIQEYAEVSKLVGSRVQSALLRKDRKTISLLNLDGILVQMTKSCQ